MLLLLFLPLPLPLLLKEVGEQTHRRAPGGGGGGSKKAHNKDALLAIPSIGRHLQSARVHLHQPDGQRARQVRPARPAPPRRGAAAARVCARRAQTDF